MSIKARNSPRELFLREPLEGSGPLYGNLIHPRRPVEVTARQRCEEMWRLFQPLADPNFHERIPFEFHQRWFEMNLGAALVSAGLDVRAPTPGRGPDFEILADGRRVYIEAVCATAGDPGHADHVAEPVYRNASGLLIAAQVPHDRISLQIATSVRAKLHAFDRYRVGRHVTPDDACVIALNLRGIPHAWAEAKECFFRAVYVMGDRVLEIDPQAGEIVAAGRKHRTILTRASGASETVAPMLDPIHSDVCAILGSSCDAWNMRTPFGDDLVLMPHANAEAPYPRGLIRRGIEITLNPAEESGVWDVNDTDYGAPKPFGPERFSVDYEDNTSEGEWQLSGQELRVRIAGRACAVPFRIGSGDPVVAAREIAIEMIRYEKMRSRN